MTMDARRMKRALASLKMIRGIIYRFVVKALASSALTFAYTFGILFAAVFMIQFFQGWPSGVVEVEPVSLLLIPVAAAMVMVCLRFALMRRYSNISP
ncbi:MAG: hypothetical protein JXC85_02420 [Candidatus Aenigmarchaeota archaeon]|nr:hypothetical protein [Candidatus Aenigmarchaeota archaeon]